MTAAMPGIRQPKWRRKRKTGACSEERHDDCRGRECACLCHCTHGEAS